MHFVRVKLSAWAILRYLENDWKCWEENLAFLIRVSLCFPEVSGIKFLCDSEFYAMLTILQQTWAEVVCTTCSPSIFKEDAHGSYPGWGLFSHPLSSPITFLGHYLNPEFPQEMWHSFHRFSHAYTFWEVLMFCLLKLETALKIREREHCIGYWDLSRVGLCDSGVPFPLSQILWLSE